MVLTAAAAPASFPSLFSEHYRRFLPPLRLSVAAYITCGYYYHHLHTKAHADLPLRVFLLSGARD